MIRKMTIISRSIPSILTMGCICLCPSIARSQTFDESVQAARNSLERYDFPEVSKYLSVAKKKMRSDIRYETGEVEMLERQLDLAKSFIRRVEKIQILDSIAVSKEDFFKAYRLPASAGSIEGPDALPFKVKDVETVFTNEEGDFKMWAQPDSTGFYNIAESIMLTDGSWSAPVMAPESLGEGANAEFPFMMPDGVTLYFASDGEGSMGGYDIFVATRDAQTGEYLQPQNIGMPYNSPFDDYMMAIDEENGVGWWATDRNQLGDDLTVYLFKVNDTRTNYDPDEEEKDIEDLALITDYRYTIDPDEDYSELLKEIKNISPERKKKKYFHFPKKGGGEYTSLDDFQTSGGREAMKKYLDAKHTFDSDLSTLAEMRRQVSQSPSPDLKDRIRLLEKAIESERENLFKLRNEVYREEGR